MSRSDAMIGNTTRMKRFAVSTKRAVSRASATCAAAQTTGAVATSPLRAGASLSASTPTTLPKDKFLWRISSSGKEWRSKSMFARAHTAFSNTTNSAAADCHDCRLVAASPHRLPQRPQSVMAKPSLTSNLSFAGCRQPKAAYVQPKMNSMLRPIAPRSATSRKAQAPRRKLSGTTPQTARQAPSVPSKHRSSPRTKSDKA
mmetsp:Transcript_124592/g.265739  ORF Transcript_124592/g.265739 Transcript_124592/m.265739 type:complete len:201 (-) Transcript_124592:334-936(-)